MTSNKKSLVRTLGRGQRGMTLLEILIVLAIIATVMGLLFGKSIMNAMGSADEKTTRIIVQQFASQGYPRWKAEGNRDQCPGSLKDLIKYVNSDETVDQWGNELVMVCGAGGNGLPEGMPFGVMSLGADGKRGSDDDIKSWEKAKKKPKS